MVKILEIKIGIIPGSWSGTKHKTIDCMYNDQMFVFKWDEYDLRVYVNKTTKLGKKILTDLEIENVGDNYKNKTVLKETIKYMAADEFLAFLKNIQSLTFTKGRDSIRREFKKLLTEETFYNE